VRWSRPDGFAPWQSVMDKNIMAEAIWTTRQSYSALQTNPAASPTQFRDVSSDVISNDGGHLTCFPRGPASGIASNRGPARTPDRTLRGNCYESNRARSVSTNAVHIDRNPTWVGVRLRPSADHKPGTRLTAPDHPRTRTPLSLSRRRDARATWCRPCCSASGMVSMEVATTAPVILSRCCGCSKRSRRPSVSVPVPVGRLTERPQGRPGPVASGGET